MRRSLVYAGAGATLAVAAVLAAAGVGEEPGALSNWQAFVLALVQGATELLPISSSAHLILVPWLGDWTYLEQHDSFNQTFDVALHLGTLIAVVVYFWHDIVAITIAWLRTLRRRTIEAPEERLAWIVLVATLPAALVGLAFEDQIAEYLGEPWQIAIVIAVFALVLLWADRQPQRRVASDLSLVEALGVGVAQALALIPGVSRSGITISAGRFLRLDRDSAARLSFLLLIPTVLGAVLLKGVQGRRPRRSAARLGRAVRGRHPGGRRRRATRDRVAARLRAPARLLGVRLVSPRRRRPDRPPDRHRRPVCNVLGAVER